MIRLFLRKTLYDIWDYFLYSLAFNIAITAPIAAGFWVLSRLDSMLAQVAAGSLFFLAAGVILTAVSSLYGEVSDYRSFSLRDIFPALRMSWRTGLKFFALLLLAILLLLVSVPFYFSMMTLPGFLISAFLLWGILLCLAALQWFLPVYYRLNKDFKTCLRKSFVLFFDNVGFSVFLLVFSVILLAISFFLGFLLPGWTAVLIAQQGALRLRMAKYDWMEEEEKKAIESDEGGGAFGMKPRRKRPRVPWNELLADEYQNVGRRTLKSFFFPWKS